MPVTLFLVPALLIALIAWIAAWRYTHTAEPEPPRDEVERLRNHALWLEQRLDLARREKWDRAMVADLSHQLGLACDELARARQQRRRGLALHE
jgi:hypothetical protein